MKSLKIAGALAALATFGAATAASADTYTLNLSNAQSGLPAPYGQVEVTQGVNALNFKVTLFDNLQFVDTGAHYIFSFSLDGEPAISLTAPVGMTLDHNEGAIDNPEYSGFDYGVNCTIAICGNGGSSPISGPLTFTITGTGLNLSMLGAADDGILFASDTIGVNGATGTIAGGALTPGVPEPATWAMMILGLGMVGGGMRMRRRSALTPA